MPRAISVLPVPGGPCLRAIANSLLDDERAVNLFCAPQRAGAGRARGAARNARASRATRAAT